MYKSLFFVQSNLTLASIRLDFLKERIDLGVNNMQNQKSIYRIIGLKKEI